MLVEVKNNGTYGGSANEVKWGWLWDLFYHNDNYNIEINVGVYITT